MAKELGRSPSLVLKWAESGLIPRLKNGKFNPAAVRKAALANVNTRKPFGRSVNSSDHLELTPKEQVMEDAAVAAIMKLVNSNEVCEAVGFLGRLPRKMLELSQNIYPVPYPQNTLAGFERQTIEWLMRCIKAARDE